MATGKTDAQKEAEKEQKRQQAEALRQKIFGIQDDIGGRTRELIKRYGLGKSGGGSGGSPLAG